MAKTAKKFSEQASPQAKLVAEILDIESEVLPACPAFLGKLEGSAPKEMTTHVNAGGTVKICTPNSTLAYFTKRFASFR